jgi:hypothetical protein
MSRIDRTDAFLLFKKWRDEATPLRLMVEVAGLHLVADCLVSGLSDDDGLTLTLGKETFAILDLDVCAFEYGEPPNDEMRSKRVGGAAFASLLRITRVTGERFVLMEINPTP